MEEKKESLVPWIAGGLALIALIVVLTGLAIATRPKPDDRWPVRAATAFDPDSDEAHEVYQAAAMTGNAATIIRVNKLIGIMDATGMPNRALMTRFTTAHGAWAQRNVAFIQRLRTPQAAQAYLDQVLPPPGQ